MLKTESTGKELEKIAETFQIDNDQIKSDWEEAIDLASLEKALATKKYSHLALVHHETTTGRLNKLDSIINICEHYDCKILLDAVSSFGAEDIIFKSNVIAGILQGQPINVYTEFQESHS